MDLRIDAKKFRAATLSEIEAYNQMGGCPTPPPSNGSIPRTPDSLPSCTASRSSSLDENTPSSFTPIQAQQRSAVSSEDLSKIQKVTSFHNRKEKVDFSMVFQKSNDISPPLVFRPIDNYSHLKDNKFISIDKQEFHENKRLRIQTEDDLLHHENETKKFKPADFLESTVKSAEDNKLMSFVLKSALRNTNCPPLTEVEASIAWLVFLAKAQGQNKENHLHGTKSRKGELTHRATTYDSCGRFNELLESFIKSDFKFSSSLEENTFLDFCFDKPVDQNNMPKPEGTTIGHASKILQDSNGQLYVPLQHSIDLKKYQLQPVTFVTPVSDEKLRSVSKPLTRQSIIDEKMESDSKPEITHDVSDAEMKSVHHTARPRSSNNFLEQKIEIKKLVMKPILPQNIGMTMQEAGNKQTPMTTPPSKSKTLEQEFFQKYPHLLTYKPNSSTSVLTESLSTAKRNEEAIKTSPIYKVNKYPLPNMQNSDMSAQKQRVLPSTNVTKQEAFSNLPALPPYPLPNMQNSDVSVQKRRVLPSTNVTKQEALSNLPAPKPKIDVELASMLPHLANYNPDLFVPKLITDLTGRPVKQEIENKSNPISIQPGSVDGPKTARQKLEAKFPLMAEYHRKCLIPPTTEQKLSNKPAEPIPFPPRPITPPTADPIGREVAQKYPHPAKDNPDLYVIGPNGSTISKAAWANINWTQTPAAITRKILMCLFDKYTLATHSLSGRPSPAFKGIYKTEKLPLHAGKVADTVSIITSRVNVTPKEVRMAITTKCADECKMLRVRQEKKAKIDREFMANLELQPM